MSLIEKPEVQVILLAVVVVIVLLSAIAVTFARFYRRCGADEALVRTGSGGNKVVIGGGIVVYPILHQLLRVSLRSIKLSVERSGRNALVTRDKIRANVTTELFIKVEPIQEDVMAARSFGERNLDEHAIGELIEGKLTDALRSVAANQTFMDLHGQRKKFAEHIQASAKRAQADGEVAKAQGAAQAQQFQADSAAKVVRTEAEAEADRIRISAQARATAATQEAQAMIALAEATLRRGEAEAESRRKLVEAENQVSTKFLMRDIALKALEVLPDVTRELMTPAKSISEIKVLQLQGLGGSGGANGEASSGGASPFGVASPVLKTILEAGAAYPLLREMMAFSQVDTGKLADKARAILSTLPDEVRRVVDADPTLSAKLDELTRTPSRAGIQVKPAARGAEIPGAE